MEENCKLLDFSGKQQENTPTRSEMVNKEANIPIAVSNSTIKLQWHNTRVILEYVFHDFGHWNNIHLDNKVSVEWFGLLRSKTSSIQGPPQALKSKLRELWMAYIFRLRYMPFQTG